LEEVYDHIHLGTAAIPDPELYVQAAKKFYMDAKSPTAAPCTRFLIQLEDSRKATDDNFPIGRHSRYIAFLTKDTDFQRLEFDFYDRPDVLDTDLTIDRIAILPDSFMQRADTYYFRNFISAAAGCVKSSKTCEPLSTNTCRVAAKSEEGACADGFNNDGVGYNGDEPFDCADSDCYTDPVCQGEGGVNGTYTATATITTSESVPAPTGGDNNAPAPTPGQQLIVETVTDALCSAHPECSALALGGDCCPTVDEVYLDCCNADLPQVGRLVTTKTSKLETMPANQYASDARAHSSFAATFLVSTVLSIVVYSLN